MPCARWRRQPGADTVSLSEFELIDRYFAQATDRRDDVLLGIGDDCALLRPPSGTVLAVSMDTLVEGRHFLPGAEPVGLGHKALAVNLSDLAAMGAEPAWAALALTLPAPDAGWIQAFVDGFAALASAHAVQLVGGDTTRGPRSITVHVHGLVDPAKALRRSGAHAGDRLFVSGTLGDAGLALARRLGQSPGPADDAFLAGRLDRPTPRVALGRLLAGRASAAIDISDGLAADLGHLCRASGVGAQLELARIPTSSAVAAECRRGEWRHALAGGDDYELLFAIDPGQVNALHAACDAAGEAICEIGRLDAGGQVRLRYPDGQLSTEVPDGFDHFRV